MPAFVATYVNPQGKSVLVDIEATDPAQAKRSLRLRGIRATEIKAKPKTTATGSSAAAQLSEKLKFSKLNELLEAKPGIKDKAVFASKMSALVNAGVPIVRSIDLMASQQKMPLFKRALQSISLEVNQGISLGEALRRWPKVFDKLSIAMVEAGEAGGVLDESLKRLAKLLEDNAKLQNQIKGAMGYPVAVLFIAISVFLGMTIFIIPTFAGIFDGLGAELPWFTQMMVDLSSLLRSTFSLYLVLGLIAGIFLFGKFYATPIGRRRVDALVLKLPLFGELIQKTATAQFCRTFSSLTRAGVPILMSLDIVREITNNSIISDAISNSRQDVLQGIPLSVALGRMNVFPDMSISMLSIGEETGEMDAMLSKVADFYEDEVEATVKALTSMLEPAMIVLVGGIVASILLAMYLPMFSVFDQIK
ncbi:MULTISPECIES: type II secretion system F family protein [Cyanobium]|uniref:Pilus assembly protein PilC n=1 Tax=Cyanobium usitatum str. Tous TaxID=2116684 RepID=A0A2P7MTY4_9CYAN|nr:MULTISPECIES: type II secretion system F family protein [Cyanobium]MCP9781126.1 type II secretion system F family protein [Cyanobium sp. To12R1]MCP9783760.1 type II secretion system F family protein [Cyanobium sp. WKJ7-Wakatipu]PSJ04704.1 pilus assembly protein PilC [Cyanobium usitatum str. Tous]